MVVRGSDYIVCPACGAKNSVARETCARCGESLEGVTLTSGPPPVTDPEPMEEAPPPSRGLTLFDVGSIVAVVVLFAVGWRNAEGPPPTPTNPGLFTLATLPRALPTPTPVQETPGERDFEEGRKILAHGDAFGAIPLLSRAVAAAPGNAIYHDVLGQAYWTAGARDAALSEYAEGGRLDRLRFGTRLAERLVAAGRNEDAVRAYQDVLRVAPQDPSAQEGLGVLLYRQADYAGAVPLFRSAVKARPDDLVLKQELAYTLQATGDVAGAIPVYQSILASAPGADVSRALLAGLLYDRGEEQAAISTVREGLEINPQAAPLHLHLARMLERAGRSQEAAQNYREYARLAPEAPDAKEFEARAERLEGSSGGS